MSFGIPLDAVAFVEGLSKDGSVGAAAISCPNPVCSEKGILRSRQIAAGDVEHHGGIDLVRVIDESQIFMQTSVTGALCHLRLHGPLARRVRLKRDQSNRSVD